MTPEHVELVTVAGGRLWAATTGAGAPLVLLHGGPGAADDLGPVAALVDDLARVHRFDQRGGGRSTAAGPATIAALLDDLEALRRHWGHERWVVAGHSWGAHVALFAALALPERTRGLVLISSPGLRWGWGPGRRARRLPRLTESERAEVDTLERTLAAGEDAAARARLRDLWWLTDFAHREHAERHPRPSTLPIDPAVVGALEADWRRRLETVAAELPALDIPALVVHGDADPLGLEGAREIAELLPRGRFAALGGVGHVPWLEDAGELRRQFRAFVASE